jgi:hypothetical protein
MKNKTKLFIEAVFVEPVEYRWTMPSGAVRHGHTVVLARTRPGLRQAREKFFAQHPYVAPSESGRREDQVEYAYD